MGAHRLLATLALLTSLTAEAVAAGQADPYRIARQVDQWLAKEAYGDSTGQQASLAESVDDTTFLRRVSLDLVGELPTAEAITLFALDPSPEKRRALVDRLLDDQRFGTNWARYWRDVIMVRRQDERALIAVPALEDFLARSFNSQQPRWDAVASAFITATGDIRADGSTALAMAQMGDVEDFTAEVSRIFLGIQLQCAQCHHHPYDRWKREQFHQLAAFFPRIAVRAVPGEQRSFQVVSVDRPVRRRPNNDAPRGNPEHYMPDLNRPDAQGQLMKPVYFVTGQSLPNGVTDAERRGQIARWMTDRNSRWFARAFVNRLWAELAGRGFYEPVDDIGPDRQCSAPRTLEYLADQFAAADYDVKWLFRAIMATDAYGRAGRSRYQPQTAPFAASCPQRLRSDQLFNALVQVLGISEGQPPPLENPRALQRTPRGRFDGTFGYDPSMAREEVVGSIPQALLLMNAPEVNRAIQTRQPESELARLLAREKDDGAVVMELYLKALAREPKSSERQVCLDYVQEIGNRNEAFEDILWALVNSTEFLHRK